MKNLILSTAVVATLGLASQAMATGLVALPTAGFTVGANTSPYTLCNTTGNYGSGTATAPTAGANNTAQFFQLMLILARSQVQRRMTLHLNNLKVLQLRVTGVKL